MVLGESLSPYRSTAAWYCWRAVASIPIVPARGTGGRAGGHSRGSTTTFPPEEGVINSSNTSGT